MLISQPNLNRFVFCKKTPKSHTFPLFLSTHLTSSINIRKFQIWPRTFPLCSAHKVFKVMIPLAIHTLFQYYQMSNKKVKDFSFIVLNRGVSLTYYYYFFEKSYHLSPKALIYLKIQISLRIVQILNSSVHNVEN